MQIINTPAQWQALRRQIAPEITLGFVPTMGNLHVGHLALVKASQQDNAQTAVSLFVNPTQFNNQDDYSHYPRTVENDLQMLRDAGVDYCFVPSEATLYPNGYLYEIQENQLAQLLEGKYRPGHFNGVLTIVMKLLNIIRPNKAYFGEKDYQQALLIRQMVDDFFMDITITTCPTVREATGLAYSSRNNRLTAAERLQAEQFARIFHQKKSCLTIKNELEAAGVQVEYLEDYEARRFVAVYVGSIRLIDNYSLAE
jgi:pantoate--beta-alanine ligase